MEPRREGGRAEAGRRRCRVQDGFGLVVLRKGTQGVSNCAMKGLLEMKCELYEKKG